MSKYAVYILDVEDTEENDMAVMTMPMESGERVAGDLDSDEAGRMLGDIVADYGNNGIAR